MVQNLRRNFNTIIQELVKNYVNKTYKTTL